MKKGTCIWLLSTFFLGFSSASYADMKYKLTSISGGTVSAINDAGVVVGTARNQAFYWSLDGGRNFIDILPGGTSSAAYGINNQGQVVGYSGSDAGNRAFVWSADTGLVNLGILAIGDVASSANDINDVGYVVGTSTSATGKRSFLWSQDAGMVDIGDVTGGSNNVSATALNDLNQVTGSLLSADGTVSPFLWDAASGVSDLGNLPTGSDVGFGFDINNSTQVVGRSNTLDGDRAFLWLPDTGMQSLGTLGFGSYAFGMNDAGTIVGLSTISGAHKAMIWTETAGMLDLNSELQAEYAAWSLLEAYDINEKGWIVGLGVDPDGNQRSFLLQPVPVPASLWLFFSGLVVMFSYFRKQSSEI